MPFHAYVHSTATPGNREDTCLMDATDFTSVSGDVFEVLVTKHANLNLRKVVIKWLTARIAAHLERSHGLIWIPESNKAMTRTMTAPEAAQALRVTVDQGLSMLDKMSLQDLRVLIGDIEHGAPVRAEGGSAFLDAPAALRIWTLDGQEDGSHLVVDHGLGEQRLMGRYAALTEQTGYGASLNGFHELIEDARMHGQTSIGPSSDWVRGRGIAYAPTVEHLHAPVEQNFAVAARSAGEWQSTAQMWRRSFGRSAA